MGIFKDGEFNDSKINVQKVTEGVAECTCCANYLINEAAYQNIFALEAWAKRNLVPKGIPIGFQMAEKKVYRHNITVTDN